jgi:hypothetical protein
VKIGPFALSNDRCIAPAAEFPDRERCIVTALLNAKTISFRTKSHTRVFTAVFNGESCDRYDLRSTRRRS